MKVVINALSARMGGGQTYIKNLLRYPDAFKGDLIYILAPESLDIAEHPRIKRIRVHPFTDNPMIRAGWERLVLPRILEKLDASVLFCPGGLVYTIPPKGCLTVTMFRNMLPFDEVQKAKYPLGPMKLKLSLLEKGLLRSMQRADLVIFLSDFAREFILERIPGSLKNTATIPHGLSDQFIMDHNKKVPWPKNIPSRDYFLYVSIFHLYKNQLEVVRAYQIMRKKRHTNEMLVLAGHNDSDYGKIVRSEIERLGLEDDVIMLGHVDYERLPELYHHARLNIFASECENCPNSLLEAMGAGSPLIVSDVAPMPEFSGDAAVYFDASSPIDLCEKLLSLVDDPTQLFLMGERSRQHAMKYNWPKTVRETWQAIEQIYACRSL